MGTALLALATMGCSGDDIGPCDYVVCALDDPECVQQAASAVAWSMAREPIAVRVRLMTADQVLSEFEASREELTEEETRDRDDWFRGLALVRLMPEGYEPSDASADALRNVAAFYQSESDEIVIITDHSPNTADGAYNVLVHELVHAYQDHYRDLGKLFDDHATTFDRTLGFRALVEGEAKLFENLADIRLNGLTEQEIDWPRYFADYQAASIERARESDRPYLDASSFFPYSFGGELVHAAWEGQRHDGLNALYGRPPDSVREVIDGFARWSTQDFSNGDVAFDPSAVPVFPDGYEAVTGAHLSVWLIKALIDSNTDVIGFDQLHDIAADFLTVVRFGADEVAAVWRMAKAGALEDELAARPWLAFEYEADGTAIIVASSDGEPHAVLDAIEGWEAPAKAQPDDDQNNVGRCLADL